ncbi:MAG: YdcF family protein [Alphaproteobacteria bacterium]|nr:YdcF family protein [Alphaproteobacteria bacterium]
MIARILSALALLYVLGYALFAVLLPRPADDRQTDAIVVLTGGANRMERGLDLLRRQRAKRMLVSGVDRTVRPADLAGRYPGSAPLFACCIDLGRESVDTRSNAEEVARWLKRRHLTSVRLVTTDWHMPRARFELSRQLGDSAPVLGDAIESNPSFRQLFMEYNKYLLRRAAVLVGI